MSYLLALSLLACTARAHPLHSVPSADPVYGDDAVKASRSPETVMQLHMMRDQGLKGRGAVCLDGTDAGFYFAAASSPADANNWQIYFEGGGWCYDEVDCWGRTDTVVGSSAQWAQTIALGGIMSDDCSVNPDFCNFNRVHLSYCDGMSFAGDQEEPLAVTGPDGKQKQLYFRGKRIMDAALQTLLDMGLRHAETVLLTGCSAGGLATFLHADYVHGFLKAAGAPLKTYKSAPISGFFLAHSTVEGAPVIQEQMQGALRLQNATGGLNAQCVAALEEQERWRCSFAAYAYAHTEAPIFPLNSALDSWQTGCIFTARLLPGFPKQNVTTNGFCDGVPGWSSCSDDPEQCNATQMGAMNRYMGDFQRDIAGSGGTYQKAGNGAFLHSCHTHCEAQDSHAWTTFAVNGVTMQQAFSKWWKSDLAPAAEHTYTDCTYRTEATPHECNPTCSARSEPLYA